MSYDLMVFEPLAAPGDHAEFIVWYQGSWGEEGNGYTDPSVLSERLQRWYAAMTQRFPMNELPRDDPWSADYNLGPDIIYGCFAQSSKEQAYEMAFNLAKHCGLGFFDVSSKDRQIWLPQGGEMMLVSRRKEMSLRERVGKALGLK